MIIGPNGGGKTSILEAIHMLCVGRSFRSPVSKQIVQYEQDKLTVFGRFANDTAVGVEKQRQGRSRVRINQQEQANLAELVSIQPLQLIDAASFALLDDSPQYRREFLNWGVFHVEHEFFHHWQTYQRALKQRNQVCRQRGSLQVLQSWDLQCLSAGNQLTTYQANYLNVFKSQFDEVWQQLSSDLHINMELYQGWSSDIDLAAALERDRQLDYDQGYTHSGPHRADVKITTEKGLIKHHFSRGQKKLLLFALKLAQGLLLYKQTQKSCLYLIDDLAAELDKHHRELLLSLLDSISAQVFITAVDADVFSSSLIKDANVFHVEHGLVVFPAPLLPVED